jgi:hypothetical protein
MDYTECANDFFAESTLMNRTTAFGRVESVASVATVNAYSRPFPAYHQRPLSSISPGRFHFHFSLAGTVLINSLSVVGGRGAYHRDLATHPDELWTKAVTTQDVAIPPCSYATIISLSLTPAKTNRRLGRPSSTSVALNDSSGATISLCPVLVRPNFESTAPGRLSISRERTSADVSGISAVAIYGTEAKIAAITKQRKGRRMD